MRRLATSLLLVPMVAVACMNADAPTSAALGGPDAAVVGGSDQGGRLFTAALSGANEVGPGGVRGVGDPDGTGTARVTVNVGQGEVCYEISVVNIVLPARAAHIHEAPAGTNGPVRVPLNAPNAQGVSSGCATVTRALAKEIAADPAGYYVNVHNAPYPGGAVRGQLQ